MALARRPLRSLRLLTISAAVSLAGLLAVGPVLAQQPPPKPKKAQPDKKKKTDLEIDPDAKPKELPPLPPPEPGQWGVGGKDEEGKFAPGGQKDKGKDGDKPKEGDGDKPKDGEGDKPKEGEGDKPKEVEPDKPSDLGPVRAFYLDWVTGFGSFNNPTDQGKTTVTSLSFVFGFSWRFADIWNVGLRFPFSQANYTGPMMSTDVAKTIAAGNLEVMVNPSFPVSPHLRIPAWLAVTLPTAQGDLLGDTSSDFVGPSQAVVNLAASAARGWEEMPLFSPHRLGFRLGGGIAYDTESIHVTANTGFDLMARLGGNDPAAAEGFNGSGQVRGVSYAWLTRASFFYGFAVGPGFIEPGLRAWFVLPSLPWYSTNSDVSGLQLVVEPAVNARFAVGEQKSTWLKAGIGFIAPLAGPLGATNAAGVNIDGFRVHAEIGF
jgi:hypothetical protein